MTWGTLASLLGDVGGAAFDRTWLSCAVSFGVALLLAVALELGRWLVGRRSSSAGTCGTTFPRGAMADVRI